MWNVKIRVEVRGEERKDRSTIDFKIKGGERKDIKRLVALVEEAWRKAEEERASASAKVDGEVRES